MKSSTTNSEGAMGNDCKITLNPLTLDKAQIALLGKDELRHHVMLTCILQDLVLMLKHVEYTSNNDHEGEARAKAHSCHALFQTIMLIAKVYEAWNYLKKKQLLESMSEPTPELTEAARNLKEMFSDDKFVKIIAFVRNKFGFHYDTWENMDLKIKDAVSSLNNLEMWLSSSDSGNDFFPSTCQIIENVIIGEMKEVGSSGTPKDMYHWLLDSTLQATSLILKFCRIYLAGAYNGVWHEHDKVDLCVPCFRDVKTPYFVGP